MQLGCAAVSLIIVLAASLPARAATLAEAGKATASIVLGSSPTEPERTAAKELAHYLSKVTGAAFAIVAEPESPAPKTCIYVGPTEQARHHGLDAGAFGPEEWVMRTVGNHLVLLGGRPRGTLYAVYRFLEDVIGVHWWNPWEETIPSRPTLSVEGLNRRSKPTFRYRDIYMLYGNDGGRFAARNRLNRQGDIGILPEYGGSMDYGPPYHVHTFYMYIPPQTWFKSHPDWFSLLNGKRTADGGQLCLTNKELRTEFARKLKEYIDTSHAAVANAGRPAPLVFSISQNDWQGMCQCQTCQAIAKVEGSEAGPLLDFVNAMADSIKEEYPHVFIDTLAYMMTQKPPKTIRARDNVIVRLCDTSSNFTRPITHPQNRTFHNHLLAWSKISKNLRIWDYAVTYAPGYGIPLPTVHTYPIDYRFYAEHNVEGVFTEHEYPILADLRDFKVWMMIKLLEDPYRDYEALVRQFMEGFYGPAGEFIRQYLHGLEAAAEAKNGYLSMNASPVRARYLDLAFVQEAITLFDKAEAAAKDDSVLLRRVRHARLPLDRAALLRFPELVKEWVRAGHDPKAMPLDRKVIAIRCRDTWDAQIDFRIPPDQRAAERAEADRELKSVLGRRANVPLPERFRGLPSGCVFDFTADETRNWNDVVKRVADREAETGMTNRLELPDDEMARYKLPMPWGLYDVLNKQSGGTGTIEAKDVPGPGYHWYRMGTFRIAPSYYLYFFWSWIIQVDIDSVVDPLEPDRRFDVWARIKFEGPMFSHGKADHKNAICVERVVLVKSR
jgi:hypothetical protein